MKLAALTSLKPPLEMSLMEVLDVIGSILEKGYVGECIEVDSKLNIVRGLELYWALEKLGVKYAPVGYGVCRASLEDLGFYDNVIGPQHRVYYSSLELAVKGLPTPMVKLRSFSAGDLRVWAKLEWFNPFSLSIKDRPAVHIVSSIARKADIEGKILADASSANFGIALAATALHYGAKARVYLPKRAGEHGRLVAELMGAETVKTEAELTVELLSRIYSDTKREGLIHVNQFMNDLNFEAHLRTTSKEIDYQARAAGLKLVGAAGPIGTSGHMSAINFYFRKRLKGPFKTIMAQPAPGEHIPGTRRSETGMIWLAMIAEDFKIVDVTLGEAVEAVRRVAKDDGILIGPSGGAALVALSKSIDFIGEGGDVVVIVPDTGFKYLDLIGKKS
ncbi:MAG: pyridoxal-phosphate dependent enzyme [Thermoprotei archaeon]|nr:pyridoxal-phosphate dependent enzyme [Thermoprotei archaeon]